VTRDFFGKFEVSSDIEPIKVYLKEIPFDYGKLGS